MVLFTASRLSLMTNINGLCNLNTAPSAPTYPFISMEQIKQQNVVTVNLLDNIRKAIKKNRISSRVADIISETISRTEDK